MENANEKICPYCNLSISEDDITDICESCGAVSHKKCRDENTTCIVCGNSNVQQETPENAETGTPEDACSVESNHTESVAGSQNEPVVKTEDESSSDSQTEADDENDTANVSESTKLSDVCTKCGYYFADGEMFCSKCGAPRETIAIATKRVCPNCGAELEEGQMFCPKCGQKADAVVESEINSEIAKFNAKIEKDKEKGKKKKKAFYIIGAIVAAVILVFVLTSGNRPKDIELSQTELTLELGDTFELEYTITPIKLYDSKVKWASDGAEIAEVSEDGIITGNSVGTCVITVKTGFFKSDDCKVTVKLPTVITLSENAVTLEKGDKYTLEYHIEPEEDTDMDVKWSSSNEKVATVKDGVVTVKAAGKCVITVETENGRTDGCEINIEYTAEDYMALGDYEKAYSIAGTGDEKDEIIAENIVAFCSTGCVDRLRDPDSFVLRDAWYDYIDDLVVLEVSANNSYGNSVTNYWLFWKDDDDDKWYFWDEYTDLKDKTISYRYDDSDEIEEKQLYNYGIDLIYDCFGNGVSISEVSINRINQLFANDMLENVTRLK